MKAQGGKKDKKMFSTSAVVESSDVEGLKYEVKIFMRLPEPEIWT